MARILKLPSSDVARRGSMLAEEQQRTQTKGFTKWANAHLKFKGKKMDDITKDLQSGLNLCYMLTHMTNEIVKPPNNSKKVNFLLMKNQKYASSQRHCRHLNFEHAIRR